MALVGQDILDSREVLNQLSGQLLRRDVVGVVGWELVLVLTSGAVPDLVSEVNLTVRVKNSIALGAGDCLILHQRHVLDLFQRRVHAADGHDDACCANLVTWPVVP